MSAEAWSALGTWAGAIGTVGTLWYMQRQICQQNKQIEEDKKQYETDRKERLEKENSDKEFEFILLAIQELEITTRLKNKFDKLGAQTEDIDKLLQEYENNVNGSIELFALNDPWRASILRIKSRLAGYDLL